MPTTRPPLTLCFAAGALLGACAGGPAGDGKNDSFGGDGAKADGNFSTCQLSEVLNFVNESTTTVARLSDGGLSREAARAIVDHRHGPDGQPGTGDDDIYDDLGELDDVDFVGPVALDMLVAQILDRCEVDLETRPFIDEDTFAGATGNGFARDNVELEAAMRVDGITGQQLHSILNSTDDRGRTVFSRIAKARIMEAFSYEYDIEEMPWDGDSHDARESVPLLPLSIESGRYVPDDDGGERELDLGTDIMDDTYYDTLDYRLVRSDMVLRGRVRWDGPEVIRRLLIAAKFGGTVDDNGLKRAAKVDVRTSDGSHIETLDDDIRRGLSEWDFSEAPIEPIRQLYFQLLDLARLPTIGQHENVLILDPKVHLRSTRSRYHLDLAESFSMDRFFENGAQRLQRVRDMLQDAVNQGGLDSATLSAANALIADADALLDQSAIRSRAISMDPTGTLDSGNFVMPNSFSGTVSDHDELERLRAIAEAVDVLYHDFGAQLDDIDRDVTGTRNLDFEDHMDMFVDWRKSVDTSLQINRVYRPFLEDYQELDANSSQAIADFNAFGAQQQADGNDDFEDFSTVDAAIWDAIGRHLLFEVMKTSQRMIEASGTMGRAIWFDVAREFYVPASSRPFGNFMIDTMDMTDMITQQEWNAIPEADKDIEDVIDPAKIFHTTLVNEVQIELGNEEPYVERIEELSALVADGTATTEDVRNLEGARFVFGEMNDALLILANLKEDDLLDRLDDSGAPGSIEWTPSEQSKGILALLLLGDII